MVCLSRTSRYRSKRRSWLVPLLPTLSRIKKRKQGLESINFIAKKSPLEMSQQVPLPFLFKKLIQKKMNMILCPRQFNACIAVQFNALTFLRQNARLPVLPPGRLFHDLFPPVPVPVGHFFLADTLYISDDKILTTLCKSCHN